MMWHASIGALFRYAPKTKAHAATHLLRTELGCPFAAGLLLLLMELGGPASRALRPLLRLLPGELGSPCPGPVSRSPSIARQGRLTELI